MRAFWEAHIQLIDIYKNLIKVNNLYIMKFKNLENEIPNTVHNSFGILKFVIPNIPDVNQINTKTKYL